MPHPIDNGPFYHGTKADLRIGDLLVAGRPSNFAPSILMNHIYFTALPDIAGLAAALAPGDDPAAADGPGRVYLVEPTGAFEDDPNVTDKKFSGNPTRSYRSAAPLRIVGEIDSWKRLTPEEVADWRRRIAALTGDVIN